MKRIALLVIISALACAKQEPLPSRTTTAPKEDVYQMTGTLLSRDPAKNTINIDNKEVSGKMMAMKMDYEVRGVKVAELPADGTVVEVTMHYVNGSYYVTDVKVKK